MTINPNPTSRAAASNAEALAKAQHGESVANYPAIYAGFAEKGIAEADIQPRENVFTYKAWRALGRTVQRGAKGVRVITWIPIAEKRDDETDEVTRPAGKRPWTTTVFHVSQTAPLGA